MYYPVKCQFDIPIARRQDMEASYIQYSLMSQNNIYCKGLGNLVVSKPWISYVCFA